MHRSGTSAVTGALHALGGQLPQPLLPPADDNPTGFFEGERIVALHEALLVSFGSSWDDPSALPGDWLERPESVRTGTSLRDELDQQPAEPLLVVKDPRLCRLLPLWRRYVLAPDDDLRALLVLRPDEEVTPSISAREGLPADAAVALHARYLVEALRGSAGLVRAVVDYGALLDDWEGELWPALGALGLADQLSVASGNPSDLLRPDMRHVPEERLPVGPVGAVVRTALDDLIAQLVAAGPDLPDDHTAALEGALRSLDEVMRRTLGNREHVSVLARVRIDQLDTALVATTGERDGLRDQLDQCTAELDATRRELEETQQARSLRFARRMRELVPWGASGRDG